MDNIGFIEIEVKGLQGDFDLSPGNYDIHELMGLLQNAENLLAPLAENARPTMAYEIAEGSVKHTLKTNLRAVAAFDLLLLRIKAANGALDFLDAPAASALEYFQQAAIRNSYTFQIKTSVSNESMILISEETQFLRPEGAWVDAEFFFFGTIVHAGGNGRATVHLATREYGLLRIESSQSLLADLEYNLLYRPYGMRAIGRQCVKSGEPDKYSLRLMEVIDFGPSYKEDYIQSLIQKAKKNWSDAPDADEWLKKNRGYDA